MDECIIKGIAKPGDKGCSAPGRGQRGILGFQPPGERVSFPYESFP